MLHVFNKNAIFKVKNVGRSKCFRNYRIVTWMWSYDCFELCIILNRSIKHFAFQLFLANSVKTVVGTLIFIISNETKGQSVTSKCNKVTTRCLFLRIFTTMQRISMYRFLIVFFYGGKSSNTLSRLGLSER